MKFATVKKCPPRPAAAALLLHFALAVPHAGATPQPAGDRPVFRADDFVEFIGLAASPFESDMREKFPPETFFDLGVRYYRTGVCGPLTTEDQPERAGEWWRKTGARPMLLVDPGRSRAVKMDWLGVQEDGDFSHLVNLVKRYAPGSVAAIEAPNEPNNKFPPQDLNLKYKGETDERAATLYQNDLRAALEADPATRDIPLIMYSAIFTDHALGRPCDAFDFMNMHSYQGNDTPSSSLRRNMSLAARLLPDGAAIKPFQPTECGYNVEEDKANHTGVTGSLRGQACNIPMLLAEYFNHGIHRAWLFALHNADGYGLLNSDFTKRPGWHALRSLVNILSDKEWDAEALEWVRKDGVAQRAVEETSGFQRCADHLNPLLFTLENAPPTVHTLTLVKDGGDYFLLLWNEVRNEGGNIPPLAPVTIRFDNLHYLRGNTLECVALYGQGDLSDEALAAPDGAERGAFAPVPNPPVITGAKTLALSIPSRVVILQLRPALKMEPLIALADDVRVTGLSATENSVSFNISGRLAVYRSILVSRLGLHVATFMLPTPPLTDEDEYPDNIETVTDLPFKDESPWLEPGLGYTYDIMGIALDGVQYHLDSVVATTPGRRPDLVVESFGPVEPGIRAGDKVAFQGVIKNIGDGATARPFPAHEGMYNNSVAVTFSVDGKTVSWGGDDGNAGPLAPGAGFHCAALGGPGGGHTWLATEGTHVLKAHVDDINRIPAERGKMNNIQSKTITVGDFKGRLEMASEAAGALRVNDADFEDWVHFNAWGEDAKPSRKDGANLISGVQQTGEGHAAVNPGCAIPISYDGVQNAHAGLWGNVVGNGFTFTVPADTVERELKVYAGVTNGGRGEFSAALSDDSAPGFVDGTWNANRAFAWAPVPGELAVCYTLRYRAAGGGQKLTVAWKLAEDPNRFRSQIRLQAATLQRK